jgi:DNA recombination protein RmuC
MDTAEILRIMAIAGGVLALLILIFVIRQERNAGEMAQRLTQLADQQAEGQTRVAQRLIDHERQIQEQLERVTQRVGISLETASNQTRETLTALRERLAVVDEAQKNIVSLSSQMITLQDILSNKQARGAFGEMQLQDLVEAVLPPDGYAFQAPLGGGYRVDCLIKLPNPPGPIGIDAKFPLESYQRLMNAENDGERVQAARDFSADILKHVRAIRDKYIVPGETGDAALMFLPSEAVYAELHARYANVVEQSFRERVYIVSPTTLWATLNTIRAIFRDVKLREQAGALQKELGSLAEDVGRLDERVEKLAAHFRLATKDVDDIQTSARKVVKRAERIQAIDLGDGEAPADALGAPKPRA